MKLLCARTLKIVVFLSLLIFSACNNPTNTTTTQNGNQGSNPTPTPSPSAPSSFTYSSSSFSLIVGVPLITSVPTYVGSVSSFSIAPILPAGLNIDTTTGVLSGTPTQASAPRTYQVTATGPGGYTTLSFTLSVTTVANVVASDTSNFNFQIQQTGSSTNQTVVLTNQGGTEATELSLDDSKLAAPFSTPNLSSDCPASLAPGASCSITANFAPTAVGQYSGCFVGSYNDGQDSQNLQVCFTGQAEAPAEMSFGTSPTSFGSIYKGQSASLTLTATNTGSENAVNFSVALGATGDPNISITGGNCQNISDLGTGSSCTVVVTYQPTNSYLVNAQSTLTLSYGSAGVSESTSINLSGQGIVPGSLDTSYGSNGSASLPSGIAQITDTAVQSDGKVLVFGTLEGSITSTSECLSYWFVERLNIDGTADTSFGQSGIASIQETSGVCFDYSNKMFLQGDSIVLTGSTLKGIGIARLTSSGTLDPNFGNGSINTVPFSSCDTMDMALDGGGGAVVLANGDYILGSVCNSFNPISFQTTGTSLALAGFTADGNPDTSILNQGAGVLIPLSGTLSAVEGMAVMPNGSLIALVDQLQATGGTPALEFMNFSASGVVNTSFGNYVGGFISLGTPPLNISSFFGFALLPNGSALLSGPLLGGYSLEEMALPSGTPNASFGTAGFATTLSDSSIIQPLANGNILTAGYSFQRFLSTGQPDTTIPGGQFANGTSDSIIPAGGVGLQSDASAMAVAPDGKIVIVAGFPQYNVIRLWP